MIYEEIWKTTKYKIIRIKGELKINIIPLANFLNKIDKLIKLINQIPWVVQWNLGNLKLNFLNLPVNNGDVFNIEGPKEKKKGFISWKEKASRGTWKRLYKIPYKLWKNIRNISHMLFTIFKIQHSHLGTSYAQP